MGTQEAIFSIQKFNNFLEPKVSNEKTKLPTKFPGRTDAWTSRYWSNLMTIERNRLPKVKRLKPS